MIPTPSAAMATTPMGTEAQTQDQWDPSRPDCSGRGPLVEYVGPRKEKAQV